MRNSSGFAQPHRSAVLAESGPTHRAARTNGGRVAVPDGSVQFAPKTGRVDVWHPLATPDS